MESTPLVAKMPEAFHRASARFVVGVLFLLCVVLLWTASNFITSRLETGDQGWNKPFLITYLNTSSFALYLLPAVWKFYRSPKHSNEEEYRPLPQDEAPGRRSASTIRSRSRSPITMPLSSLGPPPLPVQPSFEDLPKLTTRETAEVAAWWAVVWFVGNWAVNASLAWTSVASVTILTATSGFFTLGLGRVFGVESFTPLKIFGVLVSFIGVVLVTKSDSTIDTSVLVERPTRPLLGDAAAILSAACYAIYVVLLKKKVVDEERADMRLMLGFAGLFSILFLLPAFPILHFTGWETFQLPPNREAWIICGINMLITLSSDYLYMLAMLKTGPAFVTVGISLTIPLTLTISYFFPDLGPNAITALSLIGAVLVCLSFGAMGWSEWKESDRPRSSAAAGESNVTLPAA
ncbi:hypothetical protein BCR39DRAFT_548007 [Naematelia encephala]|uniref:EamA domain-containing protein n=1 Tax=Naematelia encephala TaxID=71784 RepID=A0A1Y2ANB9_9TREE|nr:hypothetical protein BCR39DRAFT_548007 [Naematelia encephala]